MKDGDKGYRSMLPCYYKEKKRRGGGVHLGDPLPKNDNEITFFKIAIRVTVCKIVGTL